MSVSAIGHMILQRRKHLRVTQPDLAQLAGISVNTLYKMERGQGNPTLETIDKVADILGMELTLIVRKPTS